MELSVDLGLRQQRQRTCPGHRGAESDDTCAVGLAVPSPTKLRHKVVGITVCYEDRRAAPGDSVHAVDLPPELRDGRAWVREGHGLKAIEGR